MLSRQLLVQLFWEICNTMQFKKTWFHILLHRIHFLKSFTQSQSNFNVDSNSDSVLAAMWSAMCDPHWFPSPLQGGYALLLQFSEADGDPWHGQHPLGWAGAPQGIQQVGFAKSALQGLPRSLCCSFASGFLLIFKSLCWKERLNTWKLFFSWSQKRTAIHCRNSEGICLSWWPGDFERALNDIRSFEDT